MTKKPTIMHKISVKNGPLAIESAEYSDEIAKDLKELCGVEVQKELEKVLRDILEEENEKRENGELPSER